MFSVLTFTNAQIISSKSTTTKEAKKQAEADAKAAK